MSKHEAPIRRPGRPTLVAGHRRHRFGGAGFQLSSVDVEPFATVDRKGNASAVGRPRRIAFDHGRGTRAVSIRRERLRLPALWRHGPDAIEIRNSNALAVG
jgi:hypothetical protein